MLWPQQCSTFWSGALRNVTRHFYANWPVVDPGWFLHDLWPHQYITLWSVVTVLPIKFCSHTALLGNLTFGWTRPTPTWTLTQQYFTFRSGVLPTKVGVQGAFLKQPDLWTFDSGGVSFKVCPQTSGAIPDPPPYQVSTRYLKAWRSAHPYILP